MQKNIKKSLDNIQENEDEDAAPIVQKIPKMKIIKRKYKKMTLE